MKSASRRLVINCCALQYAKQLAMGAEARPPLEGAALLKHRQSEVVRQGQRTRLVTFKTVCLDGRPQPQCSNTKQNAAFSGDQHYEAIQIKCAKGKRA